MAPEAGSPDLQGQAVETWQGRVLELLRQEAGDRAAALQPLRAPAAAGLEALTFALGDGTYGVEIQDVAEILLPRPITPLPRTPAFVLGVASLRGAVLPTLDLSRRLGLDAARPGHTSRILVLKDGDDRVGFWVDRVLGVARFARDQLENTEYAAAVDPRYLAGIGYDRSGALVALLGAARLCDFDLDAP